VTETYGSNPIIDEILDDDDTASVRLDRAATERLARAESRAFASTTSVRQAVRDDIAQGRDWARAKAEITRDAIVEQPLKSALYAVGVGVLIGLLLRR
jgi:ElaB/YqjD/DUF883 family membrane-anchored ribosome-binding protein